jgi:FixJ family two-component response regulator
MQIGSADFLIKPFDDEQFLGVIHRALAHWLGSSSSRS